MYSDCNAFAFVHCKLLMLMLVFTRCVSCEGALHSDGELRSRLRDTQELTHRRRRPGSGSLVALAGKSSVSRPQLAPLVRMQHHLWPVGHHGRTLCVRSSLSIFSVRESVFYVFFHQISKTRLFTFFWKWRIKKSLKVFCKSFVLNPLNEFIYFTQ